jgi:hypothetical protein
MKNNLKFSEIIKDCVESKPLFIKTAVDYRLDELVVFQYVKSTKNVWVDKIFSDLIEDKKLFEFELREHFFGRVKNVYFDHEINELNESFDNEIKKLVSTFVYKMFNTPVNTH